MRSNNINIQRYLKDRERGLSRRAPLKIESSVRLVEAMIVGQVRRAREIASSDPSLIFVSVPPSRIRAQLAYTSTSTPLNLAFSQNDPSMWQYFLKNVVLSPSLLTQFSKQFKRYCKQLFSDSRVNEPIKDAIIKAIGLLGVNFNKTYANSLLRMIHSKERLRLIKLVLTQIYTTILRTHSEDPQIDLTKAIDAYRYICVSPFFDKLPVIDIPAYKKEPVIVQITEVYRTISQQVAEKSNRMLALAKTIDALETNKRQPLQLFGLKREYENISEEYKRARAEQKEIFNSLLRKK